MGSGPSILYDGEVLSLTPHESHQTARALQQTNGIFLDMESFTADAHIGRQKFRGSISMQTSSHTTTTQLHSTASLATTSSSSTAAPSAANSPSLLQAAASTLTGRQSKTTTSPIPPNVRTYGAVNREGSIVKRGNGWPFRWVDRIVILRNNNLMYFPDLLRGASGVTLGHPRGCKPIGKHTFVSLLKRPFEGRSPCLVLFDTDDAKLEARKDSDNFILSSFEAASDPKWILQCSSVPEARSWLRCIEQARTLSELLDSENLASLHDHKACVGAAREALQVARGQVIQLHAKVQQLQQFENALEDVLFNPRADSSASLANHADRLLHSWRSHTNGPSVNASCDETDALPIEYDQQERPSALTASQRPFVMRAAANGKLLSPLSLSTKSRTLDSAHPTSPLTSPACPVFSMSTGSTDEELDCDTDAEGADETSPSMDRELYGDRRCSLRSGAAGHGRSSFEHRGASATSTTTTAASSTAVFSQQPQCMSDGDCQTPSLGAAADKQADCGSGEHASVVITPGDVEHSTAAAGGAIEALGHTRRISDVLGHTRRISHDGYDFSGQT